MNERIKLLAKQAVEETQLMMIMEYKNFESKLYEKFAELIVKECVCVCNKQIPNWKGEYATAFGDGVEFCISGIKEHFGVEE
jgi:hypothetical protein